MRNPDPRQDQKTHVIGNARQAPLAGRLVPANESVPLGNSPSGGAIQQAAQLTALTIIDQILEVLADRAGISQIVVLLQEFTKHPCILWALYTLYPDGLQTR